MIFGIYKYKHQVGCGMQVSQIVIYKQDWFFCDFY